jgi:hypothetical protein
LIDAYPGTTNIAGGFGCNDFAPTAERRGDEQRIWVFKNAWDEMLPLNVIMDEWQVLNDNEIIVAIIWELTWMSTTG